MSHVLCTDSIALRRDLVVQNPQEHENRHVGLIDGAFASLCPHCIAAMTPDRVLLQVLSDELVRSDSYLESVVKKVERQLFESAAAGAELARQQRAAAGAGQSASDAARMAASPAPAAPQLSINNGQPIQFIG